MRVFKVNHSLILYSSKKRRTTESVIKNELKHSVQWLRGNNFSLNETKSELIIFRSPWKQLTREPGIRLNNCKLELHTPVKYLEYLKYFFVDKVLS